MAETYQLLATCRVCGTRGDRMNPILSLGDQPLANKLAGQADEPVALIPLTLVRCPACRMVQLTVVVDPEVLFSDYAYAASTVRGFQEHFDILAKEIVRMKPSPRVVDIGSNDGILLRPLMALKAHAVGIEPAANLAARANGEGLRTINAFFDEKSMLEAGGIHSADVVVATNVFAHIDDISGTVKNVKHLLKPDGVFVVEVQNFLDMVEKTLFDNIYHEHVSYWTLETLTVFFARHGMSIVRAERIPTHGGSLRVWASRMDQRQIWDGLDGDAVRLRFQPAPILYIESESLDAGTIDKFANRVDGIRQILGAELVKLQSAGKTVVGYGAPAKASTLLNYLGRERAKAISFVVDDSPLKQGKWIPGVDLPILAPEVLEEKKPDVILILAWNYADQIKERTAHLGAKYLVVGA